MIILAVESSCDETAVALVEDGRKVLSDQIISQVDLHKVYGGVVRRLLRFRRKLMRIRYILLQQSLSLFRCLYSGKSSSLYTREPLGAAAPVR